MSCALVKMWSFYCGATGHDIHDWNGNLSDFSALCHELRPGEDGCVSECLWIELHIYTHVLKVHELSIKCFLFCFFLAQMCKDFSRFSETFADLLAVKCEISYNWILNFFLKFLSRSSHNSVPLFNLACKGFSFVRTLLSYSVSASPDQFGALGKILVGAPFCHTQLHYHCSYIHTHKIISDTFFHLKYRIAHKKTKNPKHSGWKKEIRNKGHSITD